MPPSRYDTIRYDRRHKTEKERYLISQFSHRHYCTKDKTPEKLKTKTKVEINKTPLEMLLLPTYHHISFWVIIDVPPAEQTAGKGGVKERERRKKRRIS